MLMNAVSRTTWYAVPLFRVSSQARLINIKNKRTNQRKYIRPKPSLPARATDKNLTYLKNGTRGGRKSPPNFGDFRFTKIAQEFRRSDFRFLVLGPKILIPTEKKQLDTWTNGLSEVYWGSLRIFIISKW